MGTDLAIIKSEFAPRLPMMADLLAPFRIPANSFQAGALAYFESNTILKYCEAQSVINAITTFAVQGIHLDPGSGHGCIVPFGGKAQPIVMVKGYTVLAARGGYTLQARLVREGDKVREIGGSDPRIEHEPVLGGGGKIIGTYAVARSKQMPTLFTPFITIDDVIATRDRSKGYLSAKKDGKQHPWITDFNAMALKTGKRLLAKDIPNDMLGAAAWLDVQHDMGQVAYLRPNGAGGTVGYVDAEATAVGDASPYPDRQSAPSEKPIDMARPRWVWIVSGGQERLSDNEQEWLGKVLRGIDLSPPEAVPVALERNADALAALERVGAGEAVAKVRKAAAAKAGQVSSSTEVGRESTAERQDQVAPTSSAAGRAASIPDTGSTPPATTGSPDTRGESPAKTAEQPAGDVFWSGSLEIVPKVPPGKKLPDWPAWDATMRQRAGEALTHADLDRLLEANRKHIERFKLTQPAPAAALEQHLGAAGQRLGVAA